jgi:MFS family permease
LTEHASGTAATDGSVGRGALPPEAHRWGGLLWQRSFRLLWTGETTSSVGNSITSLALPLVAVKTLHASTFVVSILYACSWLPWLVIGLPAGAWVDRLGRRPLMIVCDAVSMVVLTSVPVAAWCGVLTLAQLLAVAVLAGAASVFFSTAYGVYLSSLVSQEDLVEGNTKLQGSRSAAQVAGPGAAGLIAQLFGAVAGLVADATTFVVSALCLRAIKDRETVAASDRRRTDFGTEISAGLRLVAGDPYFRVLLVYGAVGNLALTGWQALEVVFLVRDVGASSAMVGLLLALIGLGGVGGAVVARTIAGRCGTAHGLLMCALGTAPFGLLVPLTGPGPRLALFAVGGTTVSAGLVASSIIVRSFRQLYCPAPLLGRLTATMSTVAYSAIPLGAFLAGTLGTLLGSRDALWVMTGALAASATILLVGPIRRHRELPIQPPAGN